MIEIYRDIPGYEGMYQCSNLGNVRSNYSGKWKLLKQFTNKAGYKKLILTKNGKIKNYLVHRLVAITFPEICGVFEDGLEINHKDCNPSNNEASNIEVCTHKYNLHYDNGIEKRKKSFKETFDKKGRQTEEIYKQKKYEYDKTYYQKNRDIILAKRRESYRKKKAG